MFVFHIMILTHPTVLIMLVTNVNYRSIKSTIDTNYSAIFHSTVCLSSDGYLYKFSISLSTLKDMSFHHGDSVAINLPFPHRHYKLYLYSICHNTFYSHNYR